ncbi:MAG: hypothetical protein ACOX0U_10790 [Oscillospiraceae bacterium]|jgi:hypothetical protein
MSWTDIAIPLAFLLVLGGMAFLLVKGGQKADSVRAAAAMAAGYTYTPKKEAKAIMPGMACNFQYRLSGTLPDGSSWHMDSHYEFVRENKRLMAFTRWSAPIGRGTVLLLPPLRGVSLSAMGGMLRSFGMDLDMDISKLAPVQNTTGFDAYADDAVYAVRLLSENATALSRYAATYAGARQPVITIQNGRCVIHASWNAGKPDDMIALAKLGIALARSL